VSASAARAEARRGVEAQGRLCVVLGCHHVVCALPIDNIDRLVLPDAVERVEPPPADDGSARDARRTGAAAAGEVRVPDVVRVGTHSYAAWDLGLLFGLGPVSGTWVLLSLTHDGAGVRLALRTGPCFAVQTLRNLLRLPGEIFEERRGAMTDGFATETVATPSRLEASVGVLVDPRGLWTGQELQISAAVLDAVEGRASGK